MKHRRGKEGINDRRNVREREAGGESNTVASGKPRQRQYAFRWGVAAAETPTARELPSGVSSPSSKGS
jgi:hypothetical protein